MPGWTTCCILEHDSQNSRQNENTNSDGQQHFPSYFHELIEAVARERGAIPDIEIHEASHLRDKPEDVLNAIAHRRRKQYQSDQTQNGSESCQANRLNAEVRMLRHATNADEGDRCQCQESQSGEEREHQIPSVTGQCVGK